MCYTNYPDGTSASDPCAPWNQESQWEHEHCHKCVYFYHIPKDMCDTNIGFCSNFGEYVEEEEDACSDWKWI